MTTTLPAAPMSLLRQRLIEDMNMRRFSRAAQRNYVRDAGLPAPTMNSIVAAQRFFFTHSLDRPDLARKLFRVAYPRKLPVVLGPDEQVSKAAAVRISAIVTRPHATQVYVMLEVSANEQQTRVCRVFKALSMLACTATLSLQTPSPSHRPGQ